MEDLHFLIPKLIKLQLIKTLRYWQKDRDVDWENRTESPEINPHTYGQLIFNMDAKTIQWEKDSSFNK